MMESSGRGDRQPPCSVSALDENSFDETVDVVLKAHDDVIKVKKDFRFK